MPLDKEELMLLGRIDGKLDGITAHLTQQDKRIDALEVRIEERNTAMDQRNTAMDNRLRLVEQKAALTGAFSGTAVSIGVALLIEGAKQWIGGRGGMGQ